MMKGFNDKVAIITGGTTGIGKATSELLAERGCSVYVLDIEPFENQEKITYVDCNVSDYGQVRRSVAHVYENEGRIDHLFANAGIHMVGGIEDTTVDEFLNIYKVNVNGIFYVLREVLPLMREQRKGSVVLMGSDQTFVGKGKSFAYGSTKGAIGQMTKGLAIDYAQYNVRVNCICPGTIDTPLARKAVNSFSEISSTPEEEIFTSLAEAQPIKRLGRPEEVAKSVVFLLSDEASYVTGALWSVDGGYTCQ